MDQLKNSTPPKAQIKPRELHAHGHKRSDDYYWLNERENPEVIEYLRKENEYTSAMMEDTQILQENIYREIIGRIKQTDMSVPYFINGYFYYTRYEESGEYPVYCRKKETLENAEEIMLDVNELAKGHEFFNVSGITVSPDNRMINYGVDNVGRRIYTIHFKNLESGDILEETVPGTSGSATWAGDNKTLFMRLKMSRHFDLIKFSVVNSVMENLLK